MSRVAVVGLGKLGCPLAAVFASKGHKVVGVDLNEGTVETVNRGLAPVLEPGLQEMMRAHPFAATTNHEEAVKQTDTAFIIVPTPSDDDGRFSNRYIIDAITSIGEALNGKRRYYNIVVCSTVMPGSCGLEIRMALEKAADRYIGATLGLCYSPEFIALGSVIHDIQHPDIVLIGQADKECGAKLARIMRTISDAPIKRMTLTNAEIAKISLNAYVTMKISFANVLAEICETIPAADAHVVTDAIGSDSRVGRKYLTPGAAYGGPCFPRDTRAFTAFAQEHHGFSVLAEATQKVNEHQLERVMDIIKSCASDNSVAVLGLAYKPGTDVTEAAFGTILAERLKAESYRVATHDPTVPTTTPINLGSLLNSVSTAVITTPCDEYKNLVPDLLTDRPGLVIIDLWDVTKRGPWDETQVYRAGVG